jgi:hypothetical protein
MTIRLKKLFCTTLRRREKKEEGKIMRCPKCKKEMSALEKVCGACGYVFDKNIFNKLSCYFGLKNQFRKLWMLKHNFQEELEVLNNKIKQYEEMLTGDLKNLAANLPKEEILIIGIILTIFGVGYYLKYSFEQGWIGPAGRVAMSYLFGIGFLFGANKLIQQKFNKLGLSLYGGGAAILYSATFAAFQIYHLFNQPLSMVLMILITMLVCSLSIFYNTKWLAVLGLVGGFLTPMLLNTGQDNQVSLMLYMIILNSGLIVIAFQKKWELLNVLGFIFTYLLFTVWYANHYCLDKFWVTIVFLNLFYLTYSIVPFAYQLREKITEKMNAFYIMIFNSFFAFGYSYFMIKQRFAVEWVSVVTIIYAAIFLLMANYLYKKNMHQIDGFIILISKAAFFLVITIPIMFSQHWITVFWMAQVIVLFWLGIKLNRHTLVKGSYVLFAVTLYKFLFYDYGSIFKLRVYGWFIKPDYGYMIIERYLTLFFLLAGAYIFARMVKETGRQYVTGESLPQLSQELSEKNSSRIYAVWGSILFIVLNIETAAFFHDYLLNARFAAISVLWTVFSVMLMVKGFKDNNSIFRRVALGLFIITIMKVFFVDISNISTPYRVISFILLGLVLIQVSFLYYKYKDKLISVISGDKKGSVKRSMKEYEK